MTEKTGCLIGAKLVDDHREVMLITNEGIIIRMAVSDISIIGRNTSGVKLMNIDPESDVRVASIAKVRESGNQDGEEENEDSDEASQQNEKIDDENSAGSFAEDLTEENS